MLHSYSDTLFTGNEKIAFPGIPSFSPEIFAYIRNPDTSKYKAFSKGIDQLLAEGAVQALRQRNDDGGGPLILAAVGQLQFEVVQARLKDEYGVDSELEQIDQALEGALTVLAPQGRLSVISFHSLEDRMVKRFIRRHSQGESVPHGLPIMEAELNKSRKLKAVGKAMKPSDAELEQNPRARSSVLRVAERLDY